MQFLNPGLVAGALLFAVPLVIHLLNRQRHKRRPWAAMEFLLAAYQKTRNRLRNENLLLLLLRCLIPIVLALAVARPVLQQAAALLGHGGSVHHVVVLDGSYSMGYQQSSGQSPFDRGRALTSRLLDQIGRSGDRGDRVTLVVAGVRPRFLVRSALNIELAKTQWLDLQRPEDAATDLTEAMAQVGNAVEEGGAATVQVYVLTDLQTRAFGKALLDPAAAAAQGPQFKDTLRDQIERLRKRDGTTVHVIDVGPFADKHTGGLADNVQVTGLRTEQPVALVRVPMNVFATLRNRGSSSASVQATLEIDGGEPMRRIVALEPGAEAEAEFQLTFRETGRRRLHVALQNDGLEADDAWDTVVEVRDRVRVLVVDGAADDDPLRCYAAFYRAFLDPPGWQGPPDVAPFEVTACDTLALLSGQRLPANFDVTVLADVDRLNERATAELQKALQAGKGVLVAFGEHTEPESYNLLLGGDGPMPFRLGGKAGSPAGSSVSRTARLSRPDHPALREFDEDVYREIVQQVPVYQWYSTVPDSLREGADVVMQLSDRDQSPLLVCATAGEGKVAFLTSAPAPTERKERWNRFDDPMIAFHLLHGLIKWLALPAQDPFNVSVGTALTCSLPARATDIELVLPERAGGGKQPVSDDSRPLPGGRFALPPLPVTVMAGVYVCDLQLERESVREPWSAPFAVHVDPDEGLLQYAAHEDVQQALGVDRIATGLPATAIAAADPGGSEYGPLLLLLTLCLVVGEAAMGRYVAVRRT